MRTLTPRTRLSLSVVLALCVSHCRFDLARLRPDAVADGTAPDAPPDDVVVAMDTQVDDTAPDDAAPDATAPEAALDAGADGTAPDAPDDAAPDAPADVGPEATPCSLTLASTAGALNAGGALLLYDTVAGAPNQATPSCVDLSTYTSGGDRIYRYRVNDGTTLTASTENGNDTGSGCPAVMDTTLTLATHCEATSTATGRLSCVDDSDSAFGCDSSGTGNVSSLTSATVTPGQDVFVTVDSLLLLGTSAPPEPRFRLSITENAVPLIAPPAGTNPYCMCPTSPSALRAAAPVNFPVMSLTAAERTFSTEGQVLTSSTLSAAPFANHAGGVFEFRLTASTLTGSCRALFDLSFANLRVTSFAIPSPTAGGPLSTVLRTPPMTRGTMLPAGSGSPLAFTLTLRSFDNGLSSCSGSVRFDWGRVTLLGN